MLESERHPFVDGVGIAERRAGGIAGHFADLPVVAVGFRHSSGENEFAVG